MHTQKKGEKKSEKYLIMYALCAKTVPALSVWRKCIDPTCVALEASTLRHCSEICLQTGGEAHIQCGAAVEHLMTLFSKTFPVSLSKEGIMSVIKNEISNEN